ncbi:uncharacterized protein LOC113279414 [Papaver somniferum]|uniref:uncharacterized protein LOC113279414 n=1 Tax=Papaver somniferum TaxID=3469 RepID=UPI000E6F6769|nr:uncharacterized protein LOC113279414 [Papaver somniferum]
MVLQDSAITANICDWINKHLSSKDAHIFSVLTTAWCIWKDRCFQIFQQKPLNTPCTIRLESKLISDTNEFLASSRPNSSATVAHVQVSPSNRDLPPDCCLVYYDASYDKHTNKSGVGIVIFNQTWEFKGCKTVAGQALNPEEAECTALFEAVKWVKARGYNNIFLRSDAKNATSFLNKMVDQISWLNNSILEDCLFILRDFIYVKTEYVSRNLNDCADKATKYSRKFNVSGEWLDIYPPFSLN